MKTRNATTVINLIDAHLHRVLNIPANYGRASLEAAVNAVANGEYRDKVLDGTFGQTIHARLHFAKQKGDAFAAAILVDNPREANNRWCVLTAILDARRSTAHGTERADDVIKRDVKLYGYNVEIHGNEIIDAPDFFWNALDLIDARGIRDDVSLLDAFNKVDAAVNAAHRFNRTTLRRAIVDVYYTAKLYGSKVAKNYFKRISRRQCRAYWRFLNIRDRYVHTGNITVTERAWLAKYAKSYGVEI